MPVLSGQTSFTGLSGVTPNLVFIDTNDTVATVTTAGYLNHAVQEGLITLQNGYMALVNTQTSMAPHTPKVPVWLQVSITGTAPNLSYSLVAPTNGGGAIFLGNVQAGANGIAGAFLSYPATINTGHLVLAAASNAGNTVNTITNASMAGTRTFTIPDPGVTAANFLLNNFSGVQQIVTGSLQTLVGNFLAGSSGNAGTVSSFPATAANGALILAAVNAGGPNTTTISNTTMAQSSVVTIPDPGAATARFLVAATATPFTANHIIVASGTGGLMADAGYQMKTVAGAAAAGGAAAQSFTDAFCTTASNVIGNWNTQANPASVLKIVPGNGSFVVTSSADAGVGTFNYIITKV